MPFMPAMRSNSPGHLGPIAFGRTALSPLFAGLDEDVFGSSEEHDALPPFHSIAALNRSMLLLTLDAVR